MTQTYPQKVCADFQLPQSVDMTQTFVFGDFKVRVNIFSPSAACLCRLFIRADFDLKRNVLKMCSWL